MSKESIEKGHRIKGKKANAEKYIPFYEFLLFDPLYRKMNEKAKILYTYLRNKIKYFEYENERYEQGEGTKSYLDEDGNTFIIADNTELCYILNCAESTLIRIKKELSSYGLLEEITRKDKSNQIYPLEPQSLSDSWKHIEEIKNIREIKNNKHKNKRIIHKSRDNHKKNGDLQNESHGDLQNESHGDLQNESHGDLQNEREIEPNSSKSNLRSLNNNLSITDEEINKTELPLPLQKTIRTNQKRLIDSNISLDAVEVTCSALLEDTPINTINFVLQNVLANSKGQIKNFNNYFNISLRQYYENLQKQKELKNKTENTNEVMPDWFKENKQNRQNQSEKKGTNPSESTQYQDIEELKKMIGRHTSHS